MDIYTRVYVCCPLYSQCIVHMYYIHCRSVVGLGRMVLGRDCKFLNKSTSKLCAHLSYEVFVFLLSSYLSSWLTWFFIFAIISLLAGFL